MYSVYLIAAIILGSIDWWIKGRKKWEDNTEFERGWSWHLFMFAPYLVFVIYMSYLNGWENLFFILVYINQDATFYYHKSVRLDSLQYNSWFPDKEHPLWKEGEFYWLCVFIINGALICLNILF